MEGGALSMFGDWQKRTRPRKIRAIPAITSDRDQGFSCLNMLGEFGRHGHVALDIIRIESQ
jgi:hypothetical protein